MGEISTLRRGMIEDMTVRNLSPATQQSVTRHARGIMELDKLGFEESFTTTATRLPRGKFSVRSGTSNIETVILADRVLAGGARREAGHRLRRPRSSPRPEVEAPETDHE